MNDAVGAAPRPSRVAFVVKGYPRLSETFVAQEILALEQRGLGIHYRLAASSDRSHGAPDQRGDQRRAALPARISPPGTGSRLARLAAGAKATRLSRRAASVAC